MQRPEPVELLPRTIGFLADGAWPGLSEDTSAEAQINRIHYENNDSLPAGHRHRFQRTRLRRLKSTDLFIKSIEFLADVAWPDTSAGAQINRCPKRNL